MSTVAKVLRLAGLCAALFSLQASASVVTYSDRASFNAAGTIVNSSNFDDFAGSFNFPSNPFTRGGVTYSSQENLIVGACSYSIGCARSVMSNNYWSPLTGSILASTTQYDLFGFDLAVTSGAVSVTVNTNVGSYVFSGLSIANGNPNFTFLGFAASSGEYFTGFRVDTLGGGYLPGMTDVALGTSGGTVPEPTSFALAGLALVGMAATLRRKSAQAV